MNKLILCFFVGVCVVACACPCEAQTASTAPVVKANSKSKQKQIEVKDYKSFKEYVANEEVNLKTKPITTDNGPIKNRMKKMGVDISLTNGAVRSKDRSKTAFLSPDKKGVSVIDAITKSVSHYNSEGDLMVKIPLNENPKGVPAFSKTRYFDIKETGVEEYEGGFDLYDLSGKLIGSVTGIGGVDAFLVSNSQKHLLIVAGSPEAGHFIRLYDMAGEELWKQKIIDGGGAETSFSLDDKYVAVKIPTYWTDKKIKTNKTYVFAVESGGLLSEEDYEN